MLGKASHRTRKRLEEHGRTATATVLEIASRGMTITSGNDQIVANTKVVLKTKLRVEPDGEPAFEVEQRFRYSQFAIPSAGTQVAVVYDPDDHDKIMLSEDPVAQQQSMLSGFTLSADQQDLIARLTQAKADGASRESMRDMVRQWGADHGTAVIDPATFSMPAAAPAQESTVDQLTKLGKLRDSGVLTEAEFEVQKAKILSGS